MALRYRVPGPITDVHPADTEKTVPVFRPPQTVEFRRGAKLRLVAQEILASDSCKVDAAIGSGKSTLLPKELFLASKRPVFHVVPSRLLALDLFRYVTKCANEDSANYPEINLATDDNVQGTNGVTFISAPQLVSALLRQGNGVMQGKVVFLDEAHESDAYTHVLRTLAIQLGASNLVMASATFSSGDFRRRETVGKVAMKTFSSADTPETWNVSGSAHPWCVANLRNNLLVFTDSRTQARGLVQTYAEHGVTAYRLEAGMAEDEFTAAMAAMRDSRGQLVALIADYSFRSGFTMDVGTIIDTGRVAYYDATEGPVKRVSRPMFAFESEQAAGRGGRMTDSATYYRVDVEPEHAVCELEGTELEAAAYLFRCLGFKPVGVLAGAVMASRELSGELSALLNNFTPLVKMAVRPKGSESAGSVTAAREFEPGAVSDVVGVDPLGDVTVGTGSKRSSVATDPTAVGSSASSHAGEFDGGGASPWEGLAELLMADAPGQDLAAGVYYMVSELCRVETKPTLVFPDGLDSVLRLIDSVGVRGLKAMSRGDKRIAVRMILDRYNVLNVELAALQIALSDVTTRIGQSLRSDRVRTYFIKVLERGTRYGAERARLLEVFSGVVLAMGYRAHQTEAPGEITGARADVYVREFERVLRPQVAFDDGNYMSSLARESQAMSLKEMSDTDSQEDATVVSVRAADLLAGSGHNRSQRESGDSGGGSKRNRDLSASSSLAVKVAGKGNVTYDVYKPPFWTGFKEVHEKSVDGKLVRVVGKPGKVLRAISRHKGDYYFKPE